MLLVMLLRALHALCLHLWALQRTRTRTQPWGAEFISFLERVRETTGEEMERGRERWGRERKMERGRERERVGKERARERMM